MTHRHHKFHSPWKRGAYSFALITVIMAVGTSGMWYFEGMRALDAFYFMSMIATAQGPPIVPHTAAGKLFASFMAFLSTGAVITSLGFLFGPFFGQLWHLGAKHVEEEASRQIHDDHPS